MTPGTVALGTYVRGDTITAKRFTLSTGESPDLNPIDLTGAEIAVTFRLETFSELKEIGDGITVIDAAAGIFQIDAFDLGHPGAWTFDVQITFPANIVKTYVVGTITIINDVTK